MNIYRLHIYSEDSTSATHLKESFPIFCERLPVFARNAENLESPDDVRHIYIMDDGNDRGRIIQASGYSYKRGWFTDLYTPDGRRQA